MGVFVFSVPSKELFSHFHAMNVLTLIAKLHQDEGGGSGESNGIGRETVGAAAEVHFGVLSILAIRKRPTVFVSTIFILVIPFDPSL